MDDITEILIRAARREASDEQLRMLDVWRERSPENEEWYADVQHVLELSAKLHEMMDPEPVSTSLVLDLAAARERERGMADAGSTMCASAPAGTGWWRWGVGLAGAAAAAAIVVIGYTGLADRFLPDGGIPGVVDSAGPLEYQTDADGGRSLQLPSGILAHLGPSSRIEMDPPNQGEDVRISLEGRAFFGVAVWPDRRVIVETPGGSITVIGTRFEAYATDEELQLLVVDGTVDISAIGGEEVRVTSGERGGVTQGTLSRPIRIEDPLVQLEWMGRGMVFQRTPLDQVALELSFRYGTSVTLGDPALRDRNLTAVFDGQPLEEVVDVVCRAARIACEIGDTVVLGSE